MPNKVTLGRHLYNTNTTMLYICKYSQYIDVIVHDYDKSCYAILIWVSMFTTEELTPYLDQYSLSIGMARNHRTLG